MLQSHYLQKTQLCTYLHSKEVLHVAALSQLEVVRLQEQKGAGVTQCMKRNSL